MSPDGRRLAILTKERTLLVLTLPDLSCLVVHKLDEETEAQESDPVQEPQGCSRGSIAWRNDSHYFAVNVKKASKGREEGNENSDVFRVPSPVFCSGFDSVGESKSSKTAGKVISVLYPPVYCQV